MHAESFGVKSKNKKGDCFHLQLETAEGLLSGVSSMAASISYRGGEERAEEIGTHVITIFESFKMINA